ncbi:MAG: acetyl-CoA acetyltransferase [Acidimicrobiales bacterium]|jgi:acetyl-CoA C-acetyltransferase
MVVDPRTPVIVGAGQVTNRPGPDGSDLTRRAEPVALMVEALTAAVDDCSGNDRGGAGPDGRKLLEQATSLRVLPPLSWEYVNPGRLVAEAMGIEPDELVLTTTGGNNAQRLVNRTALAIGRGELEVAVITGADCVYTLTAARRHPDRPVLPWTAQRPDVAVPTPFGNPQRGTTDAEEERGLDLPVHVYPLFENALRARAGRGLDQHRQRIAALWAGFSEVAATNPYAWLREPRTAAEIATPGESNRLISYPYTKLLTANMQVDQGAALILCSAGAAAAAGVPRHRWVFPLAGADADDHWFLSHRADFHSSPAIRLAAGSALVLAGTGADAVAHLDLYSCFPSAVEIAAAEIGVATDDPSRPLTVTGGLTFAGGPGNNYGTHAVASMVATLRADPGSLGLVSGLGWHVTGHSIGVYGTEPPAVGPLPELPDRVGATEAAGFRWADPQGAVGGLPQCSSDADALGEVTVETYSVGYERDGTPWRAVVACRTPDGRRTWANVTDPDHLSLLVTEEGCGRLGTLRTDGEVDLS